MTRDERVNRHFQNSVREKLSELMVVMSPGEQILWGSLNQKDLLKAAKKRIEEELAYESLAEPTTLVEEKTQGALALPKQILPS